MTNGDLFGSTFTVQPDMEKNLARNVPTDVQTYRKQVDKSLREIPRYDGLRREKEFIQKMAGTLAAEPNITQQQRLTDFVSDVWLRYEVLSRSVDFRVSPLDTYLALDKVGKQLQAAIDGPLCDELRDQRVAEDRGYEDISKLEFHDIEIKNGASLAEKATISRLKLAAWLDELNLLRAHFNYKRSMVRRGKPGEYSLPYAVIALGDFYSNENERGDKATVNTFTIDHSGKFLDFVNYFFQVVDPRVCNQAGVTFPESVRKIAQKRPKDPDCYKLLDGDSDTQALLDFMGRVDRMR